MNNRSINFLSLLVCIGGVIWFFIGYLTPILNINPLIELSEKDSLEKIVSPIIFFFFFSGIMIFSRNLADNISVKKVRRCGFTFHVMAGFASGIFLGTVLGLIMLVFMREISEALFFGLWIGHSFSMLFSFLIYKKVF